MPANIKGYPYLKVSSHHFLLILKVRSFLIKQQANGNIATITRAWVDRYPSKPQPKYRTAKHPKIELVTLLAKEIDKKRKGARCKRVTSKIYTNQILNTINVIAAAMVIQEIVDKGNMEIFGKINTLNEAIIRKKIPSNN
jgi:hypothetical protein